MKQYNNLTMDKGFTIIEVIIALGLFTVGVVVALSVFPKGLKLERESKEISVATNLAGERLEELITENYDDIPVGTIDAKARIDTNPQSQFYIYQRSADATFVDSNLNESPTDTGLKKITVTTYFLEGFQEKTIQLIRLLNKK